MMRSALILVRSIRLLQCSRIGGRRGENRPTLGTRARRSRSATRACRPVGDPPASATIHSWFGGALPAPAFRA